MLDRAHKVYKGKVLMVTDVYKRQFTTVANSIENHYERILNFFVNRSTNAAAEAFNAKIKAFRASFRGVVDMSFFLFRLAKVYA